MVNLVWRERWPDCRCLHSLKKHLFTVWILRCISSLTSLVDRFVSFKDVKRIDYEFLLFHISLLDWGAIYATHVVDERVCLLTGFIGQLFEVCVPLRRRFVPD
jgi:hypothetical protein